MLMMRSMVPAMGLPAARVAFDMVSLSDWVATSVATPSMMLATTKAARNQRRDR